MKIGILDQNKVVAPPPSVRPTLLSNPSGGDSTSGTSKSYSIAVPATTSMLAAFIAIEGNASLGGLSAITYGGTALSLPNGWVGSAFFFALAYMLNPPVGTANLAFSCSAGQMLCTLAQCYCLKDATVLGTPVRNLKSSGDPSANLTILDNAFVLGGAAQNKGGQGGGSTPSWVGSDLTILGSIGIPNDVFIAGGYDSNDPAGAQTFGFNGDWNSVNEMYVAAIYSG